jgi:hypothetical protein
MTVLQIIRYYDARGRKTSDIRRASRWKLWDDGRILSSGRFTSPTKQHKSEISSILAKLPLTPVVTLRDGRGRKTTDIQKARKVELSTLTYSYSKKIIGRTEAARWQSAESTVRQNVSRYWSKWQPTERRARTEREPTERRARTEREPTERRARAEREPTAPRARTERKPTVPRARTEREPTERRARAEREPFPGEVQITEDLVSLPSSGSTALTKNQFEVLREIGAISENVKDFGISEGDYSMEQWRIGSVLQERSVQDFNLTYGVEVDGSNAHLFCREVISRLKDLIPNYYGGTPKRFCVRLPYSFQAADKELQYFREEQKGLSTVRVDWDGVSDISSVLRSAFKGVAAKMSKYASLYESCIYSMISIVSMDIENDFTSLD